MRVLLTARSLVATGGVEFYVLDVCRQLVRRGHTPVVYAPQVGPFAEQFEGELISVVSDLSRLKVAPDVIHGNYGLSTFAAALKFGQTPIVHVCHGWHWPGDLPPRLRRVRRYLAVDCLSRERLWCQHGLEADEVEIVSNGVNLLRFPRRPVLPYKPQRALAFSNYIDEATVAEIQQACTDADIHLDAIGRNLGLDHPRPEEVLGEYDLVFAKGRCAWEALATGCAVVAMDRVGLGPMISFKRFKAQRRANFGRQLLVEPVTAEGVAKRIAAYDAHDATRVTEAVRGQNSLEVIVDRLIAIYTDAIKEQQQDALPDPEGDRLALERFGEQLCREYTAGSAAGPRTARDRLRRLRKRVKKLWKANWKHRD